MTTPVHLASALADRYRIERELGQGGMATVYLAEDLKHGRKVAIKVLHPELSAVIGGERFLAEIKVTASLQHPHILGLIDSGAVPLDSGRSTLNSDDSRLPTAGLLYYVMPYVSGESLRDRLTRDKQLPIDDATRLAKEVASALDYAHRQGVVHRDIKPENILLQDGSALVADFGIALAVQQAAGARMTQTGLSLGTPAYMSPEQAMGERDIGPRSDVYALGAMTYEMLVGDPPFTGSTVQAIVARVMTEKPMPPSRIRDTIPPNVEHAVLTALQKLPADRFSTAKDFADSLADTGRSGNYASTVVTSRPHGLTSSRPQALTSSRPGRFALPVLTVAALALAAWALSRRSAPSAPPPTVRFLLGLAPGTRIATPITNPIAISPDGDVVAFSGRADNGPLQIFARHMDELGTQPLPGTEGGEQPFFSPDGKWIAFFANHQLKKVAVAGGPPTIVAELPGGLAYGGSWVPDGRIVVSRGNTLSLIPAGGGAPSPLSAADTATDRLLMNPRVLPDGKTVIVTRWRGSTVSAELWVATIGEGKATDLQLPGAYVLGMIDSHLVYDTHAGVLMAVPFDLGKQRPVGPPVSVLDGIQVGANGAAQAALAPSGSLVYQTGALLRQLLITDLHGAPLRTLSEPRQFSSTRFSPDGSRIAMGLQTQGTVDIWMYDLRSQTLSRITTEGDVNDRPEWTPDGKRVVFRSNRGGTLALWSQPVDGTGKAELLLRDSAADIWEGVLTDDGASVIYRTGTIGTADIWIRQLTGDTARRPLASAPFTEWSGRPSHDGKWLAYESNETGDFQVYVRPIAEGGARQQVSIDGGVEPVWSRDGSKLYYRHNDEMVVATLARNPGLAVAGREVLFRADYPFTTGHANYDIAPDEKRVLLQRSVADSVRAIVVHNWGTELRAKLAAAGK